MNVANTSKGLHGLENQGATCYLNSVLQVLFMTEEIHKTLVEKEWKSNSKHINQSLKEMFVKMEEGVCGTEGITDHMGIGNVWKQQDAGEYLERILNKMSCDLSQPFCGEMTEKIECFDKHCIIEEPSKFWTLPVYLSDCSSVTEGLQKMFQYKNRIIDDVYCNDCQKKTTAKTRCEMTKLPQILVLLVKKSDTDQETRSFFKCDPKVQLSERSETSQVKTYTFCGVVDHSGGLWGGHYTTTLMSEDNTWYKFNDQTVNKVEAPYEKMSSTSYLLIYREIYRCNQSSNNTIYSRDDNINGCSTERNNEEQREDASLSHEEMGTDKRVNCLTNTDNSQYGHQATESGLVLIYKDPYNLPGNSGSEELALNSQTTSTRTHAWDVRPYTEESYLLTDSDFPICPRTAYPDIVIRVSDSKVNVVSYVFCLSPKLVIDAMEATRSSHNATWRSGSESLCTFGSDVEMSLFHQRIVLALPRSNCHHPHGLCGEFLTFRDICTFVCTFCYNIHRLNTTVRKDFFGLNQRTIAYNSNYVSNNEARGTLVICCKQKKESNSMKSMPFEIIRNIYSQKFICKERNYFILFL